MGVGEEAVSVSERERRKKRRRGEEKRKKEKGGLEKVPLSLH